MIHKIINGYRKKRAEIDSSLDFMRKLIFLTREMARTDQTKAINYLFSQQSSNFSDSKLEYLGEKLYDKTHKNELSCVDTLFDCYKECLTLYSLVVENDETEETQIPLLY